jgi:MFS family permease
VTDRARRANVAALGVPAFRRYLLATSGNNVTVWLFQTAMSWLILSQTQSAAAVGMLFVAWSLPALFTMILAGVYVDRIGPRRGMLASQAVTAALFVGAAALAFRGELTVERALVFAIVVGAVDGFWSAPSLVMAGRVVEPQLLGSAMGLSSLTFGFGRTIGGFFGGMLVAAGGAAPALAAGALGPAIAFVLTWTLPAVPGLEASRGSSLRDFRDALRWMAGAPTARTLFALGLAVATFAYSYVSLMPILTRDLLRAGPADLGLITAATGLGVIAGALGMEALGRALGRGRTIAATVLIGSAAVVLLGVSRSLPVSMALAGVTAGVLIVYRTTTIALLQALAPARMRGRVLSIFEIGFWGVNPAGGVLGGLLADRLGTMEMFFVFGSATAAALAIALAADRALGGLDLDARARVLVRGEVHETGPEAVADATADVAVSGR